MALSGLDIFKLLPKKNCKKCGRPTCLAFAMQIAQKKASIDECPDVSAEAKAALADLSPQKRLIAVDEVAHVVAMLCADGARGINGKAIAIDGGQVMR